MIGGGKSKSNQLITILPEGYRPLTNKAFPALCRPTEEGSVVVIQLVVQTDGWVYLHTMGADTVYDNMFAVMLDNINFELD